jgi:glycosyltransferase involved in cell wall biosynthesis
MSFPTQLACQDTSCDDRSTIDRKAYLVDDYWPEFDRYVQATRTDRDYLFLPVANKYSWNTSGFVGVASALRNRVSQARSILALRATHSILLRIVRQASKYQQFRLSQAQYLAQVYGRSLIPDFTHLVITQSLLPYFWQARHLRGRSFDVLMTALPIDRLQERLDLAARLHPQSRTLNNFRVLPDLAAAEIAALEHARQIITPHKDLATLWREKTKLLDWVMPTVELPEKSASIKPTVMLPSASLGRKGIYELKAALNGLDIQLIICGLELEEPGFWQECDVRYLPNYAQALSQATVVVSPAWVEHQPRRILQSIACGVPTIVSSACGLHDLPSTIEIPLGDVAALRTAIESIVDSQTICPAREV